MQRIRKILTSLLLLTIIAVCIPVDNVKADSASDIPTETYEKTDADAKFIEYFLKTVQKDPNTPKSYKYWLIYKKDGFWCVGLTNDVCNASNARYSFTIASGKYADFTSTSSSNTNTFSVARNWYTNAGSGSISDISIIASNYDVPFYKDGKIAGTYFAATYDHDYYTQDDTETADSNEATLKAHVDSTYTVTIPKHLTLGRETQKVDYSIKVKGDIAYNEKVTVSPDVSTFTLKQDGKDDIQATISQTKSEFTFADLSTASDTGASATGTITTSGLTAGHWSGGFNFNIALSKVD